MSTAAVKTDRGETTVAKRHKPIRVNQKDDRFEMRCERCGAIRGWGNIFCYQQVVWHFWDGQKVTPQQYCQAEMNEAEFT